MQRFILSAAALLGALAVLLGAFGAHALESAVAAWSLDQQEQSRWLDTWDVAVRYQMFHALALLGVGVLAGRMTDRLLLPAAICFLAGTVVFSGCLYALVLSGVRVLGAIVPIGGLLLIAGWLLLAAAANRAKPSGSR